MQRQTPGGKMNIGIIGAEAKKFTDKTKMAAMAAIENTITGLWRGSGNMPTIVSGHCHLGGVDIWAEEAADHYQIRKLIFPPKKLAWEGGYKQRNIQIAEASDVIYVIGVREFPPGYSPEVWNKNGCYHCKKHLIHLEAPENCKYYPVAHGYEQKHVKSGACWTAWYAIEQLGKEAYWIIV
jgi:hypothetical protein